MVVRATNPGFKAQMNTLLITSGILTARLALTEATRRSPRPTWHNTSLLGLVGGRVGAS